MQYNCKAIILKTIKLGESDKILSVYSPEYGLIKAVAKGAYKPMSSFGVKAQVLSYVEFQLAKGRNLEIVSQSKLVEDFRIIRSDYEALTFACYFVELIETIAIEDDSYENHFNLLLAGLNELNREGASRKLICLQFLWELIEQLGYKPELSRCAISHRSKDSSQPAQYFDLKNGSIVSTSAFNEFSERNPYQEEIVKIDTGLYKILQSLDEQNLQEQESQHLNSTIKLLEKHFEYRMHKPIKSWKLVEEILSETKSYVT